MASYPALVVLRRPKGTWGSSWVSVWEREKDCLVDLSSQLLKLGAFMSPFYLSRPSSLLLARRWQWE